jgi:hypothetical protein
MASCTGEICQVSNVLPSMGSCTCVATGGREGTANSARQLAGAPVRNDGLSHPRIKGTARHRAYTLSLSLSPFFFQGESKCR